MSDRVALYLLVMAAVLSSIAVVDAARSDERDLMAVMAGVLVLIVAAAARQTGGRAPLSMRRDLAAWLEQRSAVTGEAPTVLADRAVAAYRARLEGGDAVDDHAEGREERSP